MQKRINLFDLHANLRANKCMEHCEGCGETVLLLIYWYFPLIFFWITTDMCRHILNLSPASRTEAQTKIYCRKL